MLIKEIMRRRVITVDRTLTRAELAVVFEEKGITGAPVVDERGAILGIVSQTDLVGAVGNSAEELMTPGALSFDEEAPVGVVADFMLERHVHRVLVTRGKSIVGIVTSMDMLKAVCALSEAARAR